MKKTLLFICTIASTLAFGQKKLSAVVEKEYDESLNLSNIDSTAFTYNSWQGSLNLNNAQPQLTFDGDIIGYILPEPIIHCDQDQEFAGSNYPLNLVNTTINTLINARVSESLSGSGMNKTSYEYNSQGQLIKSTNEFNASGSWFVQDSTIVTYDALGNKLTEAIYQVSAGLGLINVDSIWYEAGTNKPVKGVSYFLNGSNILTQNSQSLISYTGNNIQHIDLYEDDGSGGIEWLYRLIYDYTGNQLDEFIAYDVILNTPTASIFAEGSYNYNTNNTPSAYLLIVSGDTLGEVRWEYDTDGFISKEIQAITDSNDVLFDAYVRTFHWQNTAGLKEQEKVQVSIFPNPTSDIVNVNTESAIKSIQLYNLSGQLLIEQNTNKINLTHLPSGSYLIKGSTEKGSFSKRITKQ